MTTSNDLENIHDYDQKEIWKSWFICLMLTFSSFSASCLPFYIFLTVFRVMSFSLVLVVLRAYSILLYFLLLSILLLWLFFSTSSRDRKTSTTKAMEYLRTTRKEQCLIYFIVLPFRTMFSTGFLSKLVSHSKSTQETQTKRRYSKCSGSSATPCWWSPSVWSSTWSWVEIFPS